MDEERHTKRIMTKKALLTVFVMGFWTGMIVAVVMFETGLMDLLFGR